MSGIMLHSHAAYNMPHMTPMCSIKTYIKRRCKVILVQTPHPTVTLDPEEMNSMEKKLETS